MRRYTTSSSVVSATTIQFTARVYGLQPLVDAQTEAQYGPRALCLFINKVKPQSFTVSATDEMREIYGGGYVMGVMVRDETEAIHELSKIKSHLNTKSGGVPERVPLFVRACQKGLFKE